MIACICLGLVPPLSAISTSSAPAGAHVVSVGKGTFPSLYPESASRWSLGSHAGSKLSCYLPSVTASILFLLFASTACHCGIHLVIECSAPSVFYGHWLSNAAHPISMDHAYQCSGPSISYGTCPSKQFIQHLLWTCTSNAADPASSTALPFEYNALSIICPSNTADPACSVYLPNNTVDLVSSLDLLIKCSERSIFYGTAHQMQRTEHLLWICPSTQRT